MSIDAPPCVGASYRAYENFCDHVIDYLGLDQLRN